MKKLIISISFVFICLVGFGQTSLQDYNYMKKGYFIAINMGYELRKDVQVAVIDEQNNESVEIKLYSLENLEAKSLCYYLWVKDIASQRIYTIVIPQSNSVKEVKDDYFTCVDNMPNNIKYYLIWALYRLS